MITVTFIRHGESLDNIAFVWGGWKDAELSNHGMNQAKACGEYFASTQITRIYGSPLKRAWATATQVYQNQADPKPPFTSDLRLREQYRGVAEGHPWLPPSPSSNKINNLKVYPAPVGRDGKFPEGESSNDLAKRCEEFIDEVMIPHIIAAKGKAADETQIFIVSHGLAIAEHIAAFVRRDPSGGNASAEGSKWQGLLNTAWSRLVIGLEEEEVISSGTQVESTPATGTTTPDTGASIVAAQISINPPPTSVEPIAAKRLHVKITHFNQSSHLKGIVRQKGGIGSAPHDKKQREITEFFRGVGVKTKAEE